MIFILTAICLWNPTDAAKRDDVRTELMFQEKFKTNEECDAEMTSILKSAQACDVSCVSDGK